ncbi:hypothetical protein Taro_033588, partial [Colocasia esculenta]|nr:hypothetical protein [Colocasia esculenta]
NHSHVGLVSIVVVTLLPFLAKAPTFPLLPTEDAVEMELELAAETDLEILLSGVVEGKGDEGVTDEHGDDLPKGAVVGGDVLAEVVVVHARKVVVEEGHGVDNLDGVVEGIAMALSPPTSLQALAGRICLRLCVASPVGFGGFDLLADLDLCALSFVPVCYFGFLLWVEAKSDYLFKLLLIGDSGVGKSSLLLRMASQPAAAGAARPATVQMRGQPVAQKSSCCS